MCKSVFGKQSHLTLISCSCSNITHHTWMHLTYLPLDFMLSTVKEYLRRRLFEVCSATGALGLGVFANNTKLAVALFPFHLTLTHFLWTFSSSFLPKIVFPFQLSKKKVAPPLIPLCSTNSTGQAGEARGRKSFFLQKRPFKPSFHWMELGEVTFKVSRTTWKGGWGSS